MVETTIRYDGELRCTARHGPSGHEISTDAPKDNQGKGEAFSPTDLVGAAMGTCILTILGMYARRHSIELKGATARIEKEMVADPIRRIGRLNCIIQLPATILAEHHKPLEAAAHTCPVSASLRPEVEKVIRLEFVL